MNRIKFLTIALIAGCILSSNTITAQEESKSSSPFDLGVDIYSSYIWRGAKFGSGPAFQPWVEASFGGLAVGAWGSVNASANEALEMDLYLGYSFDFGLSLTVTDYYFGGDWNDFGTMHSIEPMIGYEIGDFSIAAAYMLLAGADADPVAGTPEVGFGEEGDMYFEAGYSFGAVSLAVGAGDGQYTDDGDFMLCNITLSTGKDIEITEKFSLPMSGGITYNPSTGGFFATVGVSF